MPCIRVTLFDGPGRHRGLPGHVRHSGGGRTGGDGLPDGADGKRPGVRGQASTGSDEDGRREALDDAEARAFRTGISLGMDELARAADRLGLPRDSTRLPSGSVTQPNLTDTLDVLRLLGHVRSLGAQVARASHPGRGPGS